MLFRLGVRYQDIVYIRPMGKWGLTRSPMGLNKEYWVTAGVFGD